MSVVSYYSWDPNGHIVPYCVVESIFAVRASAQYAKVVGSSSSSGHIQESTECLMQQQLKFLAPFLSLLQGNK